MVQGDLETHVCLIMTIHLPPSLQYLPFNLSSAVFHVRTQTVSRTLYHFPSCSLSETSVPSNLSNFLRETHLELQLDPLLREKVLPTLLFSLLESKHYLLVSFVFPCQHDQSKVEVSEKMIEELNETNYLSKHRCNSLGTPAKCHSLLSRIQVSVFISKKNIRSSVIFTL